MIINDKNEQQAQGTVNDKEIEKEAKEKTQTKNNKQAQLTVNYQEIEKNAEEKTEAKLKKMFDNSHLKEWFKGSNASLFARTILELELATERMLINEYLVAGFKAKENWLKEEKVKVKQDIGKYKAGLKLSEGGDFNLFSILEWIFKTGLAFVPIIALMKIIYPQALKTLEAGKGIDFSQAGQSWQVWLAVFAGIALVQLTSESIYNWFISSSNSQEKKGYQNHFNTLRLALTKRFYKQPNQSGNQVGNSSSQSTPTESNSGEKGNNPGDTNQQNHDKLEDTVNLKDAKKRSSVRTSHFFGIDQFSLLLILIWLSEALIGVAVIFPIIKAQINNKLSITQRTAELIPTVNWWEIFLGVSIFALINLVFSVSKAKRHNHTLRQKQVLKSAIEYEKNIKIDLKHCKQRIKEAQEDFKTYREEYNKLLREDGGILNRLGVLSNMAYTELPKPMQHWEPNTNTPNSEVSSEVPTNNNHKGNQSSNQNVESSNVNNEE
jgi:hypothetical protein